MAPAPVELVAIDRRAVGGVDRGERNALLIHATGEVAKPESDR